MTAPPHPIERSVLPNGLVVITEPMPHVRSVSVGVWIGNGSRREPDGLNGLAHFIEHMVFKGTERRSAEDIAREADSLGGALDAFTTKETVCFTTKVLDEHLPVAFDILADLALRPRFDPVEIGREKTVVLEEMKMDEDNPESLVHDLFTLRFWPGHPLGRPILGTRDTVTSFTRDIIERYYRDWFAPNHMVITAAGNLEHARLVALVDREFGSRSASPNGVADTTPQAAAEVTLRSKSELEQVHITIGVPAFPVADPRRYAVRLLNTVLGDGMASRLFQQIRERLGLAYAVFSEVSPFVDTGVLSVYVGTSPENAEQVVRLVAEEFASLRREGITTEELRRGKDQLKGALMLSLESTGARMSNLARQEVYFHRFFTLDEILALVEGVTREDVQAVAAEFFRPEHIAVTVLGDLNGFTLRREHLAG